MLEQTGNALHPMRFNSEEMGWTSWRNKDWISEPIYIRTLGNIEVAETECKEVKFA
jgi:hypothetical protein